MKQQLINLITQSLQSLALDQNDLPKISIERTRSKEHGDFACNIALMLAKPLKKNPLEIAEIIKNHIPANDAIERIDIAPPGFINFYLAKSSYHQLLKTILMQQTQFGTSTVGNNKKVLIEFVSANPTGPLHVGHGRGAAYGASLANLLKTVGFNVETEYYVNDAGRQMDILALSIWLRYLQSNHCLVPFPNNAYQGDYVRDIAHELSEKHGKQLMTTPDIFPEELTSEAATQNDPEGTMDQLIALAKSTLGAENYQVVFNAGLSNILDDIRQDLTEFGVDFTHWFSERSLTNTKLETAIAALKKADYLYQKEGAWWFRATDFGDTKNRVVIRENGQPTYFASDIAYHFDKLSRGYDQLVNIWGADHHGYIPRIQAALQALTGSSDKLNVRLVQFAILYRGNERLSMSTRSGSFVTLRQLREEVSNDAARFFYVMRKPDQHLDFDLELAKKHTKDNPVYYIQYAHARIASVVRNLATTAPNWHWEQINDLNVLSEEEENSLMRLIAKYPEHIESAANQCDPHIIAHYLQELSAQFHAYYNTHKVLVEDQKIRDARLLLIMAIQQVIANGLAILGVSAPEVM